MIALRSSTPATPRGFFGNSGCPFLVAQLVTAHPTSLFRKVESGTPQTGKPLYGDRPRQIELAAMSKTGDLPATGSGK